MAGPGVLSVLKLHPEPVSDMMICVGCPGEGAAAADCAAHPAGGGAAEAAGAAAAGGAAEGGLGEASEGEAAHAAEFVSGEPAAHRPEPQERQGNCELAEPS